MFEIGDILRVKEEKKGRYTGQLVIQPYELLSIEDSSVMIGHHSTTLHGLQDNDIRHIDLEFLDNIFVLDIDFTRKLKLNKICLRMDIK